MTHRPSIPHSSDLVASEDLPVFVQDETGHERIKYPRTPHLPGSPGIGKADRVLLDAGHLLLRDVVVTEKMDGENTTLYSDYFHARSLDGRHHPSQGWIKRLQAEVGYKLPADIRICGENLFAKHTIPYSELPSFFLVFSIWQGPTCLSWSDTVELCQDLGLQHVPVLHDGPVAILSPDGAPFFTGVSACGGAQEGFVIRLADSFRMDDFPSSIAKWVRKGHVQTDKHWSQQPIVPNLLKAQ